MGGDDRLPPVLAFSTSSDLNIDESAQNALRAMLVSQLTGWRREIVGQKQITDGMRRAMMGHRAEWDALVAESETQLGAAGAADGVVTTSSTELVAPMLQTQWSQWNHFNEQFPVDPQPGSGYDGRAPVGCMPVAGAQLARFYAWPTYGVAGHTDNDSNPANQISGNFSAQFGGAINWSAMQAQYNPWSGEPGAAVQAVSDVLYRLGVALNLDFGSFQYGGSSASIQSLGRALNRCFFYERGTYMARSGAASAFDTALRNEMLAGRPAACAIPGHAVVADGLSVDGGADYFHFNYGLGGINDGWYRTSAIPEGNVESAIFGERPLLVPLLDQHGFVTNVTGVIAPAWHVAAARQDEVVNYRVREGQYVATDFSDNADALSAWTDYSSTWLVETPGKGGSGGCFRKTGEIGDFALTLRDPVIPSTGSRLKYNYKAVLVADHAYLEVSTDRGGSWQTLRHLTNTGNDTAWYSENIDLSSYAGQEVLVRMLYSFKSGSYYGASGGIWLDKITISNVQQLQWSVVADNIAAGATNCALGTRLSGTYHYEVQAYDGSSWSAASPFVTMTVQLDAALDVDADGLANGWETQYFGAPTNGVAAVDGDGHSNLQEFAAGTNPSDAASRLALADVATSGEMPSVSWSSVAGKTYSVWRATAATGAYVPVASNLVATAPLNTYADASAPAVAALFYRISVE